MNGQLEQKLADALEAQAAGQPIEQILDRYPADADLLRPHLETAASLAELRIAHSLQAQAASRERFLAEAAALKNASGASSAPTWFSLRRLATNALALAVVLLFFGAGLVAAASRTVPGDAMYGAKLAVEDLRLSVASEQQAEALRSHFNQERIREINRLLADGAEAEVQFSGPVESLDEESWFVAGLPVQITADTRIEGQPSVGAEAVIQGRTEAGQLLGERIEIRGRLLPPEIDPDAQEATPTPSPTQTPSPTPTSTPTASPTPTATATPTLIVTPDNQPVPAADDEPDDDGDDESDDEDDHEDDHEDDESDNSGRGSSDDDDGEKDDDDGPGDDEEPDDD